MIPSNYQQAVFDALLDRTESLVVEAVAGGGKTSTILEGLNRLIGAGVDPESVLFIAFNKNIATELSERVPDGVETRTFNALGHRALYQAIKGRVTLDARKTWKIMDKLVESNAILDFESDVYGATVVKLIDLARQDGIGVLTTNVPDEWLRLIDHHDLQFNEKNGHKADVYRAVEIAQAALAKSIQEASEGLIDFSDQLYLPILWNLQFAQRAFVFVDEAQDVNKIQRSIMRKVLGRNGRLIAVGDSKQAIYGFRGADVDALDLIESEFGAKRLPLSICYRCDSEIVNVAKNIVPHIEARPNADKGYVSTLTGYDKYTFKKGQAILCRNNKPLVEFAYQLIGRGVGCKIRGRDIGRGMKALIEKMNASDADDLVDKLEIYKARMIDKYTREGKEDRAQSVEDQIDTLLTIIDRSIAAGLAGEYPNSLYREIETIFTDNDEGGGIVILSSIHKAKGLEWDTVYFLSAGLIPSKWAKKDWQLEQENNLYYVGITRARKNLFYIEPNEWA